MSARSDNVVFFGALALSGFAHLGITYLRAADLTRADETDYALDETEAIEPMTVRILIREQFAPTPVAPTEVPVDILTGDAPGRAVPALEIEPLDFERSLEAPLEPPPPLVRDELPKLESDPEEPPLDLPERPQNRESPPPEALEVPDKVPTTTEVELASPVAQAAESAVKGRAVPLAEKNRKPNYPPRARALGMEGTVELRVTVKANGKAGRIIIKSSSGHQLLDDEALKTVKRWTFEPSTTASGDRIEDTITLPVTFSLKKR